MVDRARATWQHPDPAAIDPDVFLHERYQKPGSRRAALNAYYSIKPLLPRSAQLMLRRIHAKRINPAFPHWPIEPLLIDHQHALWRHRLVEESCARLPLVNFWPDAHRFAVTVTHDVESSRGIENIEAVLDVERRHSVISCWNFVAEDYRIPPGTFDLVREHGGEIGLHGVRHDGLLFRDRASFTSTLPAIHRYLRDWGAVGFRSPATHRNAEWMPELGCLYDSSFPDTDPFEPQAGGCCSIFPYFLGSLVELPITMVQDHTLWEILRRTDIELWRRKSDWVIANHGLVNLIVHPDYVRSPDRLALYDELLAYLREQVERQRGWHALPRDVASWWKARSALRVDEQDGASRILGSEEAGAWLARASLAWVSERDGEIALEL
jgi:hypothetical protein